MVLDEDDEEFRWPSLSSLLTGGNLLRILSVIVWSLLIRLFGSSAFILGLIVVIFRNLGYGTQSAYSAYSIFNKGCRNILGGLRAEQFHQGNPGGAAEREDNLIQYDEGDFVRDREPAKSRAANKPCPCGSGKKLKKCCGSIR